MKRITERTLRKLIREEIKRLNEGVTWNVDTNEPFDDSAEKKFVSRFEIRLKPFSVQMYGSTFRLKPEPVTVKKVEGQIDDDYTDLEIHFSNGDKLEFDSKKNKAVITDPKKETMDVSRYLNSTMGSTGTVVGDLCMIYKYVFSKFYGANR